MNPRYHLPILVALSTVLFLTNLGGYDLWPPDEPRFAQVAQEMLDSGDYLVPRINGQPYTEKPPVLFWMTSAFSWPIGQVTEFTARLPLALAGVATVIVTYLLARRLYDPRVAFWAGLVLVTNQRFWWQARFGQIDMLLTAFVSSAILCLWEWHVSRHQRWLVAFYCLIALGTLTKGPPALVFPLLLAVAYYWHKKVDRKQLHLFWGSVFVVATVCVWLIPARLAISVESGVSTGDGIAANLFRQTIGRFFLGISHAQWPWFYLKELPMDLMPWALFLPWTLYWVWKRRRESSEMRFLLSWIVPAFIFFSICIGKRSVYLLPLYPAIAILIARSVLDLIEGDYKVWLRRLGIVWGGGLLLLASSPLILPYTQYAEAWHVSLLILSIGAAACGLQALISSFRTDGRNLARDMVAHFTIVALLCCVFLFPAVDPYKSARTFCSPLRALSENKIDFVLYSLGFSREEYVFYARHFHEPILCELLDIPEMKSLPEYRQAQIQTKVKRTIQKAVSKVPVASLLDISDEEAEALRIAMESAVASEHGKENYLSSYSHAVLLRLDHLFTNVEGTNRAFVIVLEEDWRWIVALKPGVRKFRILSANNVGSRKVLLLANSAGAEAIETNVSYLAALDRQR